MQTAVKACKVFRRIRFQTGLIQFFDDEMVDGIHRPICARSRRLRLLNLRERPVRLILRALFDPALDQSNVLRLHRLVTLRRRHDRVRILLVHPLDEQRLLRIALDDYRNPVIAQREGVFHPIQAQRRFLRLARPRIWTMAMIAILRENRLHMLVEGNFFWQGNFRRLLRY